ncbi:hypothetical protein GCM10020254_39490 [Streptomyces goshikiensis]
MIGSSRGALALDGLGAAARLGEDLPGAVEDVQGLVAQVLLERAVQEGAHVRGVGVLAHQGGHGQQVGVALVEGAPDPVVEGVGALALVADQLLRYDDVVPGAVDEQAQRDAPRQQQHGAHGDERTGARAPQRSAAASGAGAGAGRVAVRAVRLVRPLQELVAQPFQRGPDPGGLAAPGDGDGPGQVAAGEPAAVQEQGDQRALHGADQHGDDEGADQQQGAGQDQPGEGVGGAPGALRDVDHRDDGQLKAGGLGADPPLRGRRGARSRRRRGRRRTRRPSGCR